MANYFNDSGRPQLPDISDKPVCRTSARALAIVSLTRESLDLVVSQPTGLNNVLSLACLGGVIGARRAGALLPVSSRPTITFASADFEVNATLSALNIIMSVKGVGKGGVELEAMAGASAAALSLYELLKDVDAGIRIEQVYLLEATSVEAADLPFPESLVEKAPQRPRLTLISRSDEALLPGKVKPKVKRKTTAKAKVGKKSLPQGKGKPKPKAKRKASGKPKSKRKAPAKKPKARIKIKRGRRLF